MRKELQKVEVECAICKAKYSIGYKSKQRSVRLGRQHLCRKCNGLIRVESLREGNRKYFSTKENIEKHSKLCKQVWENRSENFKEKRIDDLYNIGKEYRESINFSKLSSDRLTKYFSDPNNRELASKLKKEYWNSLSESEKSKAMEHLVYYWDNISEEELDAWYKKILDGKILSGSMKIGITEIKFMEDLNKLPLLTKRVKFISQYRNDIKHPDFNKLFPSNPFNGSKFINPYHVWDFIIYGVKNNILIDVDGSIHYPYKSNYDIEYHGKKVKLSEIIHFRDSQRPYQTDGLESYIIKAYNDQLKDDTEVLSMKDGKIINYKELLSMILNSQTDDYELEEVLKSL